MTRRRYWFQNSVLCILFSNQEVSELHNHLLKPYCHLARLTSEVVRQNHTEGESCTDICNLWIVEERVDCVKCSFWANFVFFELDQNREVFTARKTLNPFYQVREIFDKIYHKKTSIYKSLGGFLRLWQF